MAEMKQRKAKAGKWEVDPEGYKRKDILKGNEDTCHE